MKTQSDDPRHARELNGEWELEYSLSYSYNGGGSKSASRSVNRIRSSSRACIKPGKLESIDYDSGEDNPDGM